MELHDSVAAAVGLEAIAEARPASVQNMAAPGIPAAMLHALSQMCTSQTQWSQDKCPWSSIESLLISEGLLCQNLVPPGRFRGWKVMAWHGMRCVEAQHQFDTGGVSRSLIQALIWGAALGGRNSPSQQLALSSLGSGALQHAYSADGASSPPPS